MCAFGQDSILIWCFASTDLIFGSDCIESLCFASAGVVLYGKCPGILGVFQCRSASGDWCVVCFRSRLYRDFVFRVNWCCFWSRPYRDFVFCVKWCYFLFRLYRHFIFCVEWGACTSVHPHELRCADVICVGMCSFVWRGASGCPVVFSRSRWGQAVSVIRRFVCPF